jgi:amidohydrolase
MDKTLHDRLTGWRRHLHANPELTLYEDQTAAFVGDRLTELGVPFTAGVGGHGIVGTISRGQSNRSVGLRADMDALPMQELTGLPYQSQAASRMHACGHDGHTTMLLGAARYLAETRNFDGTVHFIFQPAEEAGGGANVMVQEGLFDRFPCDMVFGAHNEPGLPLGEMTAIAGPVCANTDDFWVRIHGHGGHAARPEFTIDPIVIGANIVVGLQSLVARRTSPIDPAVLSVCQFHAGTTGNVIPDDAALNGTVRTLRPETRRDMERMIGEIVTGTARAHGADAVLEYEPGYPGVVNAPDPTERAARAATRLLGQGRVIREREPSMGGEDFAYMAQAVPGCFVTIGMADGDRGKVALHNAQYDFNDDALPLGASFWATLIEQELPRE